MGKTQYNVLKMQPLEGKQGESWGLCASLQRFAVRFGSEKPLDMLETELGRDCVVCREITAVSLGYTESAKPTVVAWQKLVCVVCHCQSSWLIQTVGAMALIWRSILIVKICKDELFGVYIFFPSHWLIFLVSKSFKIFDLPSQFSVVSMTGRKRRGMTAFLLDLINVTAMSLAGVMRRAHPIR